MQVHDVGKFSLFLVAIVGVFVALMVGEIDWGQASAVLLPILTYLFGNGSVAIRGRAPSPMIVPKVDPGDVATTGGTVPVDELRQLDEPPPPPRRPGEHTTGEHWQIPINPPPDPPNPWASHPYQNPAVPPGEMPYETLNRTTLFESEQPTAGEAMCQCGHPRLYHVESQTHPGMFLWCTDTSPAIAPGTVEARCVCNLFVLNIANPDNAQFWARAEEEQHGPPR